MKDSDTADEKGIDRQARADRLQILGVDGEGYTHVHDADAECAYVLDDAATITTTERGIRVYRHVSAPVDAVDDIQPVARGEFSEYRDFVRSHRGAWQDWRVVDLSPVGRAVDRVTGGC